MGDATPTDEPGSDPSAGSQPVVAVLPARKRNRFVAVLLILVVAGMLPWTGYLAYTLPSHYEARHWNVVWSGFDVVLMAVLGYSAWAAWFRHQIMVATALVRRHAPRLRRLVRRGERLRHPQQRCYLRHCLRW